MNTKQKVSEGAQGVPKEVTVETVKEFLKRDLAASIALLNAIHSDPDCMDVVAEFLHGRWMNAINKENLKAVADATS